MKTLLPTTALTVAAAFACVTATAPVTAAPASAQPYRVMLDWFFNPDHGPLLVADALGYFDAAGLEVTLIEPADPTAPPFQVAAGDGDIAISYQPDFHLLTDQGLDIEWVGTIVGSPLNSLVVAGDGPIQSMADLQGQRIGYSVEGFQTALVDTMLGTAGLGLDDVELINVNFALSPSIYAGQVVAAIGAFRNFELNQMELDGEPGRVFLPEDFGVPSYAELIFVTNPQSAESAATQAFLAAVQKGAEAIAADPVGTFDLFIQGREALLDTPLNRKAWQDTAPLLSTQVIGYDAAQFAEMDAYMTAAGLIE